MTDQKHDADNIQPPLGDETMADGTSPKPESVSEILLEQVIDLIPMMVVVYRGNRHLYVSQGSFDEES